MKLHRFAWALGLIALPLSHYWLVAKIEPFYSSIYCFLWWSYIFSADFAVYLLRGKSLLHDRPREFLFLSIWSVPVWLLFEIINLRLQNWYYIMAPWEFSVGVVFLVLAFGTVLPGIFETMELIVGVIERFTRKKKIQGRPFTVSKRNIGIQIIVGAAMLALVLIDPKRFFCLTWGWAFFLLDPICYWRNRNNPDHIGRSLLGQLASGDNTRLVALLLAGFITGGLWESWNLGARTKWIYSVPFFDELKLGEMPILGFLGFPPFTLECYAIVNFLSLLRGGRNWELGTEENRQKRRMGRRTVFAFAIILPITILVSSDLITSRNIESFAVPLDIVFAGKLSEGAKQFLREHNALQGNQFLRLKECPREIDPALYERMRRLAQMGELKGMGIWNAMLLEDLEITSEAILARQNPMDLASQLKKEDPRIRLEEVKVWIRAARKVRAVR